MKLKLENVTERKLERMQSLKVKLVSANGLYYILNHENNIMMNVESGEPSEVSSESKAEVIEWFTNHYSVFGMFCGWSLHKFVHNSDIEVINK